MIWKTNYVSDQSEINKNIFNNNNDITFVHASANDSERGWLLSTFLGWQLGIFKCFSPTHKNTYVLCKLYGHDSWRERVLKYAFWKGEQNIKIVLAAKILNVALRIYVVLTTDTAINPLSQLLKWRRTESPFLFGVQSSVLYK